MTQTGASNRQRIAEAAQTLFYQQGFNATSFTDIAQAADIPRGNFYYYFKTKNEILSGVIENWRKKLRATFAEIDMKFSNPKDRLLAYLDFPLRDEEGLKQYGCPYGTLNTEMCKAGEEMRVRTRVLFDDILEWLEKQFKEIGQLDAPRQQALRILGCLEGASVVCNVYQDVAPMRQELIHLRDWIKDL